eukprot:1245584-Rhodomonas_salina.1
MPVEVVEEIPQKQIICASDPVCTSWRLAFAKVSKAANNVATEGAVNGSSRNASECEHLNLELDVVQPVDERLSRVSEGRVKGSKGFNPSRLRIQDTNFNHKVAVKVGQFEESSQRMHCHLQ